uniref:Tetratricopeptide repeat protein n=2 Tax=Virgibacillus oceani TaxID=1479511 RepID=A0A917H5D7_9BACI|nr:hypothetical protein GCM10011398_08540 [Virgibacillus oceani]
MQRMENNTENSKQNNVFPFIPEGDFYFTKGVEAFQKRKFDISLKWLRKAIEATPKDPLYQCQMSIVYTEIGAFHAANQLLNQVLQTTGDKYTDCYYLLANNYAHLGLLNDAKKYAKSYLDKEPKGDFSEEAESLLYLIDIDEDDEEWELEEEDELLVYQETVFHHMENMEWEQALPLLEEMITLFPDHKLTKHDYTHALFFSGQQSDAIQMELDILEMEPNSLYSHTNLALFYYESNNEEYKKHIDGLLNVYPIHEHQKLRVAVSLARTNFYQEAYQRFRSLAKGIVKGHPSYYRWYSSTAYHVGKQEFANKLWEEGCKRHPKLSNEQKPWQV